MLSRRPLGSSAFAVLLQLLATCFAGCADDVAAPERYPPVVMANGVQTQALTSGALLSANGTYGAGCVGHAGDNTWSTAIAPAATLDHAPLAVAQGNTACTLVLTSLRTGPGTAGLELASPTFVLGSSYQGSASAFQPSGQPGIAFYANAKLSALDFGSDFTLSIQYADDGRLGSAGRVASYRYDAQVVHDAPVAYWRLGDGNAQLRDTFSDTNGTLLQSHTGELGASWTAYGSSTANAVIAGAIRVRRNATGQATYYASYMPGTADYSIVGDVYVRSVLSADQAGVIGRADTATDTYYRAAYYKDASPKARWELSKVVNGVVTLLGSFNQTLSASLTYKVTLDMRGSTIRLLVNAVQRVSATDTSIAAAGRAGIVLGASGMATIPTDTTGLQLDNPQAGPLASDTRGTNFGTYFNGVTVGSAGAISGDSNSSATFDGVDDYVSVTRPIADDFSIEFWFKSTQGVGTGTNWYDNAGLVDGEVGGVTNDFGVSLRSDGNLTVGTGNPDTTLVSTATGLNNGLWHHLVFTRTRATGALRLYVDGHLDGSATGGVQSLTAPAALNFGRTQTGINYYAGSLDEVALYSSVLSAASVLLHYQRGTGM